jgi:hypothetical protein
VRVIKRWPVTTETVITVDPPADRTCGGHAPDCQLDRAVGIGNCDLGAVGRAVAEVAYAATVLRLMALNVTEYGQRQLSRVLCDTAVSR